MRLNRIAALTATSALLLLSVQAHSADEPAAPKGNCHLAGHVNGPDGKNAAGVTLKLVNKAPTKTADEPTPKKRGKKKPAADGAITATSDADGNFKIDDIPAGQYQLTATLKGVGRAVQQVNLIDGQTLGDLRLQLVRAKKG